MIARLHSVTYRYPGAATDTLSEVSFDVERGDFVLVAGPSAGGKSTLLRLFNGLVPQFHGGRLRGALSVDGRDPARTPARTMATIAGMVFQEPEAQAITDAVEDELAFGMEQRGISRDEMRRRIAIVLDAAGIGELRHRRLDTLSGGERQRVAIAGALALEPPILLLDEPTSQLDPAGAGAVIEAIEAVHRDRGLTVLIAEHRLARLLPVAGWVAEVEGGRVRVLSPAAAASVLASVPPSIALARALGLEPVPLTVASVALALRGRRLEVRPATRAAPGDELLRAEGLTAAYGEHVALRDCSFTLRQGEVVALAGPNGSGKSTLFRIIAGLMAPAAGSLRFRATAAPARVQERTAFAGLVPQDPAIALYHDTVRAEVSSSRRKALDGDSLLRAWDIEGLASQNPRDLSVGQQQRVAIAAMLGHAPPVWMLDEPTRGADGPARAVLARRLREHAAAGGAAIVATHDMESAATFATRVIGLDGGRVAFDLPAAQAFAADGPLPTEIARLVPGASCLEEVVL
ncbi:MAG: ABC transporter ATP-binding protein [Dehalococcoidia bacterium]